MEGSGSRAGVSARSRFGRGFGAVAVTTCLLALIASSWSAAAHPIPGESPTTQVGALELESAVQSLGQAQGPARGAPMSCQTVSPGSASCGPTVPSPLPTAATIGWINITSKVVPLPAGRLTTMAWDASDGLVILYGSSYVTPSHILGTVKDTWSYSDGTWTNLTTRVSGGPPPTATNPTMAYDPWTSEIVLFGGTSSTSDNLSLTWTFHADVWTNITATAGTPPSPRWVPVFVPDLATDQMILYGGVYPADDRGFDDTWLFSGTTWSNISGAVGSSPPSLAGVSGTYDAAASGIVILGVNYAGPPYEAGTYLFTGGVWHNLTASQSGNLPLLEYPAMGYVASTQSVVAVASLEFLAGNGSNTVYPVEWEFADGNWTNVSATVAVPGSGSLGAIATLPSGALLLFGGAYNQSIYTQWMYALSPPPSSVVVRATPADADIGTPISFQATFSGGLAPFSSVLSLGNGVTSDDTPITSYAYPAAGLFTVNFTLTDFLGETAEGSTVVTVNAAPSSLVIHAAPDGPTPGMTVNFSSTFAGGTGPFVSLWNFGDGTTSTTTVALHTYNSTGTYTVHLLLTDAVSKAVNATLSITVATAASGFSLTSGLGLYLLVGLLAVIVVVVVTILLLRGRKSPTSPTPSPGSAAVPPAVGGPVPPPGAPPPPG
jgi:hypothetical protein